MSESDDLPLKFLLALISGGANLKDDAEQEEALEWSYSMAARFLEKKKEKAKQAREEIANKAMATRFSKKKEEKAKQAREEIAKKAQQPSSAADEDEMPRFSRRI